MVRKALLVSLLVVVVLMSIAVGVGYSLPATYRVSRSAQLNRPPHDVWAVIDDVDAYPLWRPGLRKVKRLPDTQDGLMQWAEERTWDAVVVLRAINLPPAKRVTELTQPPDRVREKWTYMLELLPQGRTRLTITEQGRRDRPLSRFYVHYLGGRGAIDAFLRGLGERLGQDVELTGS